MLELEKGIYERSIDKALVIWENGRTKAITETDYPYDWAKVSAYLAEHPEALIPEPVPPPPTPEQVAEQARRANLSYLAATDWYSIRYAETGKVIPEDILAKRQVARDAL